MARVGGCEPSLSVEIAPSSRFCSVPVEITPSAVSSRRTQPADAFSAAMISRDSCATKSSFAWRAWSSADGRDSLPPNEVEPASANGCRLMYCTAKDESRSEV